MSQRPRHIQVIQNELQRHILMRERPHHGVFNPLNKLSHGGVVTQIRLDHQRIDEKADQVFRFLAGTTRHGNTNTEFFLLRVLA